MEWPDLPRPDIFLYLKDEKKTALTAQTFGVLGRAGGSSIPWARRNSRALRLAQRTPIVRGGRGDLPPPSQAFWRKITEHYDRVLALKKAEKAKETNEKVAKH